MPSVKLSVPHRLGPGRGPGPAEAVLRETQESLSKSAQRIWRSGGTGMTLDFGFKTYGFHVTGRMSVEPEEVRFDGQIPLAAMMFKGKIEQTVRDEARQTAGG